MCSGHATRQKANDFPLPISIFLYKSLGQITSGKKILIFSSRSIGPCRARGWCLSERAIWDMLRVLTHREQPGQRTIVANILDPCDFEAQRKLTTVNEWVCNGLELQKKITCVPYEDPEWEREAPGTRELGGVSGAWAAGNAESKRWTKEKSNVSLQGLKTRLTFHCVTDMEYMCFLPPHPSP